MSQARVTLSGAAAGLAAAILFGLSAPCAKLLLPNSGPLVLAGLLYLGAGLGLLAYAFLAHGRASQRSVREAALRLEDGPLLAGVVVMGGIVGPLLMLSGLERVSGVAGALLLNLETPFTIFLAIFLFREELGRRAALASGVIIAGAVILSGPLQVDYANFTGVLALAGACMAWALDNNLTQRLSARNPVAVARFKALGAGTTVTVIAALHGESFPSHAVIAAAMTLGMFSYGVSLVLYIRALRVLGAARQAALFATAPFVGALAAVPILHEGLRAIDLVAGLLMSAGVAGLLRARHSHRHAHTEFEHEHAHVHDEHHTHSHAAAIGMGESHSHWHRHTATTHEHPHLPDLHHRHGH
jgi:drug/metabolite transporter (DMT)-like permease